MWIFNTTNQIMHQKCVSFVLVFLLIGLARSCHSSCEYCTGGGTKNDCVTCDSSVMYISPDSECLGVPGIATLLEIVDSSWDNTVSPYLYSVVLEQNTFYSAATLPTPWTTTSPLRLNIDPAQSKLGLYFNTIPSDYYQLQVRASVTLNQDGAGCLWNLISTASPTGVQLITIMQFESIMVSYIDQPSQLAWIQYRFAIQGGNCDFVTFNDFTLVGLVCPATCRTCTSPIACLTCNIFGRTQYYLLNGACVENCTISSFDDPSGGTDGLYVCDTCDVSCRRCLGTSTYCTECNADGGYVTAYNIPNSCVNKCPNGQYIDSLMGSCLPCTSPCLTCITKASRCTSCEQPSTGQLYLHNFGCPSKCPTGTYANATNFTCIKCNSPCVTCNGPLSTNCLTCATVSSGGTTTIYYLAVGTTSCATYCPDGQFISTLIPNYCQQCSSLCGKCQGTSTFCTGCPNSYFMSGNICVATCPNGTYGEAVNSSCLACDSACASCFGTDTFSCYSCKANSTGQVHYLSLGTTQCVTSCPDGQITGSNNLCVACASQCSRCSLVIINCTKCVNTYFLQNSNCVQICSNGTYPQLATSGNLCLSCDPTCSACFGPLSSSCTACTTYLGVPYFKDPSTSTCSANCPAGYFGVTASNTCSQCQTGCASCQVNSTFCQGCQNVGSVPYFLLNNRCINTCPNGYYPNGNLCSQCNISCAVCTGPSSSECSDCANATVGGVFTQYYLAIRTTTCSSSCPQGQYIDAGFSNSCQQCSTLCSQCQGSASICTSCPNGFYLLGSTCVSTCPASTYADTLQCLACNTACATCFGTDTVSCYSCKTNSTGQVHYLSLGTTQCVTTCPDGQTQGTNSLCVACAVQCATCSAITTNCTKCLTISGVTAVFLENNNCVQNCATGTYPHTATSGNLCLKCDPICAACFGPLNTSCNACTTYLTVAYYKDPTNSTCSDSCPAGYYGVSTSNTCVQCQTGCSSCQFNSTFCQGCQNVGSIPYYLLNSRCLNLCPNGHYPNGNLCSPCNISCAVCTGPSSSECSSCANATAGGVLTQYYLAIRTTICAQLCPHGQYIDAGFPNTCQQCSSLCIYCFGNANNCTNGTCPFGYYFYINTCISVCFAGTYGNSTSWHCLSCHAACATCFSGDTSSCYTCWTEAATSTVYYLQLGTTICSTSCPPGQITGTSNNCLACATQCATCSVIQSNCTTCTVLNGASVYLQGETCTFTCLAGTYPKNGTGNNLCLACDPICSTCFGPLATNCFSCGNITTASRVTTIYFKDPSNPICSTSCPQGYVGITTSNVCQSCQAGCVACQNTTTNCQQCQVVGNAYYYFHNNSCLMICPDGTFKNNTDLVCNTCSYFTLNQQCIQQCPTGYIGVIKGSATICEGCTNCTTYNQPFSIRTTIDAQSKNFKHEVKLSAGLHQNSTVQSVSNGLQVSLSIKSRRLLFTIVPLNVLRVSINPDYSSINIMTNSQPFDIQKTTVDIQFRPGALVTPSGILYTALDGSIHLQNPTFIASYYQAFGKDTENQIQGILLISFSMFLLIIGLWVGSQDTMNEMLMLVQAVQMVGLMRVRTFPIVLSAYNVLQGFSYMEMQYIPNPLTVFITGYVSNEVALEGVKLTYSSQNIIGNFAPLLCIVLLMVMIEGIVYGAFKAKEMKTDIVALLIKATIGNFLFIILYGCLLSLASLHSNVLTGANLPFLSSIILSLIILVCCLAYFFKHAKDISQRQFYKITNFLRITCLIILAHRFDVAVICFNASELITIIIEVSRCAEAAPNPILRFMERLSMLAIINICLFIVEPRALMVGLGSGFALIGSIKLYYLIKSIYNHFQKEETQILADAKSQAIKLQQTPNNASKNFIFEEVITQKKEYEQEKSLDDTNQMRETAVSGGFPKNPHLKIHSRLETIIDDVHMRDLIGENEEIETRRKRRYRKAQKKVEEKPVQNLDELENVQIIKVQPKFTTQQPINRRNYKNFELEIIQDNRKNQEDIELQIVSENSRNNQDYEVEIVSQNSKYEQGFQLEIVEEDSDASDIVSISLQ